MNLQFKYFLSLAFVAISIVLQAQTNDVLIIKGDEMLFKLNRNWDREKLLDVSNQYSLDTSLVFDALQQSESVIIYLSGTPWKVDCINTNEVCISKQIKDVVGSYSIHRNVIIDPSTDGKFKSGPGYVDKGNVKYGLNQMKEPTILKLKDDQILFTLPGNLDAKEVIITGSFNNWSTQGVKMKKIKSGWSADLNLEPGKYLYKFIVDGHWMKDPNNLVRENDGQNGYNSVYFVNNYTFTLPGFTDARKVILAMSLNDWNEKELRMIKTSRGWELPMYLKAGTHSYKYIVDGEWVSDPTNSKTSPDGMGNLNSVVQIGTPTLFSLEGYLNAKEVRLAGSFNNWNPSDLPLSKTIDGWEVPVVLGPGNYEYKFVIDGNWKRDQKNPYTSNSGGEVNSFIAIEPNHIFRLQGFSEKNEAVVTGNFSGWNESNYQMQKKNGVWIFPIYLQPGKQLYKFIVDGEWILDPANSLYEDNEFDTRNSILWVGE